MNAINSLVRYEAMLVRYVRLRRPLARAYSNATSARPLRLAVIGSGPSGFYAASKILQTLPESSSLGRNVEIHMYDRLPTPYGLVRYGVAPDHPEVKVCGLQCIYVHGVYGPEID